MFAGMDAEQASPSAFESRRAAAQAVRWQWSRLPALSPAALYAALAARQQVFAVEQQCAYLDADGLDHHAWHLLGWDATGEARVLAAYLRLIDPGCYLEDGIPHVEMRLAVAPARPGVDGERPLR